MTGWHRKFVESIKNLDIVALDFGRMVFCECKFKA